MIRKGGSILPVASVFMIAQSVESCFYLPKSEKSVTNKAKRYQWYQVFEQYFIDILRKNDTIRMFNYRLELVTIACLHFRQEKARICSYEIHEKAYDRSAGIAYGA